MIINAQAYSAFGRYEVVASAVDHDADRRSYTHVGSAQVVDTGVQPGTDVVAALTAMIQGLTAMRTQWCDTRDSVPWKF